MDDARRFGFPDDKIEAVAASLARAGADARRRHGDPAAGGEDTPALWRGVWPRNAAIVDAFLQAASQWRTASVGGGALPGRLLFIGLDYAGARAGIEAAGIEIAPALWRGLRIMEAAALAALNESRERNRTWH